MLKEFIICSVIVVTIFWGNYITQNFTKEAVEELTENLTSLRNEMSQGQVENEKVKEEANKIYEAWKEKYDKLAYYIEHNELEKVETELTAIKSYIETETYQDSISSADKSSFLLKHIEDKYDFNLQNIF